MPTQQKRATEGKHPIELTTDEVLERLFSREVRDKLKESLEKGHKQGGKAPSVEESGERLWVHLVYSIGSEVSSGRLR